jgi:hypothetical protein
MVGHGQQPDLVSASTNCNEIKVNRHLSSTAATLQLQLGNNEMPLCHDGAQGQPITAPIPSRMWSKIARVQKGVKTAKARITQPKEVPGTQPTRNYVAQRETQPIFKRCILCCDIHGDNESSTAHVGEHDLYFCRPFSQCTCSVSYQEADGRNCLCPKTCRAALKLVNQLIHIVEVHHRLRQLGLQLHQLLL